LGAAGFLGVRRRGLAAVLAPVVVDGAGWLGVGRDEEGCAEAGSAEAEYDEAAVLLLTAP